MGMVVGSWLTKIVLTLVLIYSATAAQVHNLRWAVENTRWSPDGVEGEVITINGQFPGPTIRAQAGDTINLELTNKLRDEGTVIHWHGIRQFGTPWADGTAFISQCPINQSKAFLYTFKVDKAGTYFYHGHLGMQRSSGLYGSLIVEDEGDKEKLKYDEELEMILLSDWWHKPSRDQENDLSANPMRWIGESQTLLINGRGQFNCSLAAQFSESSTTQCNIESDEQYAPVILPVQPNTTYRLRIASSTALAALNLAIGNHNMTVVEADSNYVAPFTVENMDIYSGESYSVIFKTDQDPSKNYWISINVRGREPHTPPALAILNYLGSEPPSASPPSLAPAPSPSFLPASPPPVAPKWNDFDYSKAYMKKILAAPGTPQPPSSHDRRIVLLNTQNLIDGHTKWSINNVSLALPETPYLGAIKYNLTDAYDQMSPPDNSGTPNYDIMLPPPNPNTTSGSGVYMLAFKTTIDVILQNANVLQGNVSEIHPWHLHGHDFWILGYGEGKFSEDGAELNVKNPPMRNTAVIFPYGWTALRFVADNPGAWAFHCHLEPHLHMGMGVVFAEGVDRIDKVPDEALGCGLTDTFLKTNMAMAPHSHGLLQLALLCFFIITTINIIS